MKKNTNEGYYKNNTLYKVVEKKIIIELILV